VETGTEKGAIAREAGMKALWLIWIAASALAAADGDSFALRNVAIHPVTGPDIEAGVLVVRDGRIAGFGSRTAIPRGVRVIDARGLDVYPGMIDSGTAIGLSEIGAVRETVDTTELGDFNPQLRAGIAVNPGSEHIPVTRAAGITSVLTLPQGGVISGQAALIHLDGWTWEEMEILRTAALAMTMPVIDTAGRRTPSGPGRTPFAEARKIYEKKLAGLRDFFEAARRYRQAKNAAAADFKTDLKYEAMLPVLEGKAPLVIYAVRERAIRDALEFAGKQNVRAVLAGCREVEGFAADLKARNIPVILGPTHTPPLDEDAPYDASFTLPGRLHKAGVKIAFATFTTAASRNLPDHVATAVAYGLPYQEALRSITINPAEIWGVSQDLGSIEKGKVADLVVTDGDLLETRTRVKYLFIKGRAVDLDNKHLRLYKKYEARP
jgi:imidazolonepropionase-like amidohydrolase